MNALATKNQPKPGILERAMAFLSPRWAMERTMVREFQNSYHGGVPTRTSEYWPIADGNRFGNLLDRYQQGQSRDRAYHAYKNNPVARTLVQTETDNVIGDGLNYQPISSSPEWNKEAEDKYYEWIDKASVRGPDIHSGCKLQRLLWDRSRVAGDIGWILVAQGAESRIQVVAAENIATPDGMAGDPGVYDGVRFDANGAPVTFYIKYQDDKAGAVRRFAPIAARDFVYLAHMTEPMQARGETCFITIFDLLSHLDRYVDGVSLAAWMATVFGLIIKDTNPTNLTRGLPMLTNSQGNQQRAVTFENGQVKYVGTESEVAQVEAKQPMQYTTEFIRTFFRMLGQPFDMPLEVVAKDMSTVTFASARIGLLPFYRSCRIKATDTFGKRWSRTIRWWLSRERNRADDDPKRWKTKFPEDFWSHDLLPNAWQYTDPVAEAQGDHLEMGMRTKSPQMVIAERGRNAEKILRDWEEWDKKTKGMPTVFSTLTRPDPADMQQAQAQAPVQPDNAGATQDNAPDAKAELRKLAKEINWLSETCREGFALTHEFIDALPGNNGHRPKDAATDPDPA